MASIDESASPVLPSASRTTGTIDRRCSREASSGTTPPYFPCVASCDATTDESTRSPSSTMAAAVSSHEDSKARMRATTVILTSVRVDEFSYELPPELIAQQPLENRANSRMLVVHRSSGQWEDRMFWELPLFIESGDCLILNDSRVLPSRLFATRPSGPARIEVFLVKPMTDDQRTWQALVRPGRKVAVGEKLRFSESLAGVVLDRGEHGERTIQFECDGDLLMEIERVGHVPLPPYIRREDRAEDRERYQTVYADQTGSVAAPTAGLHFTPEILDHCRSAGANIARVTLHVGLGTFAPIHATEVDDVKLHFERYG